MFARRLMPVLLLLIFGGLVGIAHASDCTRIATGMVPLNDLGTGTYHGVMGGLYPGGTNVRPAAHTSAGLAIANAIGPLDTLGQPDAAGRVVIVSIGMSNCTQEFSAFVPKAIADAAKAANVLPIDCALGGQAADVICDPAAAYWDTVRTRLRGHGSAPLQPQVVWIKEAERNPSLGWPAETDSLALHLGSIVRIIHQVLPNVRLCYLTSRIYAGYATSTLNPEPYAYESGFAVRDVIAAQIAGVDSLRFDQALGAVQAPWLSWGPYLWADGLTPRSDGLTWACADFASDGTHPSASGRDKVADSLLVFLHREDTATPWYRAHTAGVPPPTSPPIAFRVWPDPARAVATLEPPPDVTRVEIVDAGGRRVRTLDVGGRRRVDWDLRDDAGRRVAAGLYWLRTDARGVRPRALRVLQAR